MNALLVLIILVISTPAFSQGYASISSTVQTSWNTREQEMAGEYTDSLVVVKDSVINGNTCQVLSLYSIFFSTPALQSYTGYIRQELTTGRAWYWSSADTNKRLFMDLSLSYADSFKVHGFGGGSYYKVDSVYYKAGKKHVRLNLVLPFSSSGEKFTMIEGTGTNIGVKFTDSQLIGFNSYLLCHYKASLVNYHCADPAYQFCNTITGSPEIDRPEAKGYFYPNPAAGAFAFKWEPTSSFNNAELIILYNGNILSRNRLPSTPAEIRLDHAQAGLYIGIAVVNGERLICDKVIVLE